jgi:hypothetical protein
MTGNGKNDTVNDEFCNPQGRKGYERADQAET